MGPRIRVHEYGPNFLWCTIRYVTVLVWRRWIARLLEWRHEGCTWDTSNGVLRLIFSSANRTLRKTFTDSQCRNVRFSSHSSIAGSVSQCSPASLTPGILTTTHRNYLPAPGQRNSNDEQFHCHDEIRFYAILGIPDCSLDSPRNSIAQLIRMFAESWIKLIFHTDMTYFLCMFLIMCRVWW